MIYTKNSPSSQYLKLIEDYKHIHIHGTANKTPEKTYNGVATASYADYIKKLLNINKCKTLLDYGSGKGDRYYNKSKSGNREYPPFKDFWNIKPTLFDPGVPHPKPKENLLFDAVISVDVLEHIPIQDLPWVIEEIFNFAKELVFINIACYTAIATLPDGGNAHVTVKHPLWWCGFIHAIASKKDIKTFIICSIKEGDKIKRLNYTINDDPKKYS